jgi:2-phosphoglycerate kinase
VKCHSDNNNLTSSDQQKQDLFLVLMTIILATMRWGPSGELSTVLWIGGAQWSGKSTVAWLLSRRFGLTAYHYDFHDARGHYDRALAHAGRYPHRHAWQTLQAHDPDTTWVRPSPQEMAEHSKHSHVERFGMVLDDLRALSSGRPLVAEGWGLRPELVAPLLAAPEQAVFLVPSEPFRQRQLRELPRAGTFSHNVSDPERAQANRLERDRLLAVDVMESARAHGLRVIEVDGSLSVGGLANVVADHFSPWLS